MGKQFEDYFSELQTDMVCICLEYVENKADKVYIYCSFESNMISSGYFYKINGKIIKKHKLNDVLKSGEKRYDVSVDRQKQVTAIINDDIKALNKLCHKHKRDMPTQIKIVYDVINNKLNADYCYDPVFSRDKNKTAYDVLEEWYQAVCEMSS